jgi:hypothetical protein
MREWSIGGMLIGRGKLMYLEKSLPQCHVVYHTTHMDCPEIKPGSLR